MSETPVLDSVAGASDLRKLSRPELIQLAEEIRGELIGTVADRGGHLASNLGVVELTIALLRVFDPDSDRIVWDTGHQGYVYKLLTGRRKLLQSLRQDDGCCGFLLRDEDPSDVFGAGHAGTALSAALGIAAARDSRGDTDAKVLAVVGDGAIGTGVSLEGINSMVDTTRDLILVLNDNKMSISPNVGALSRYLNRIIAGERYIAIKRFFAGQICRIPRFGHWLKKRIERVEAAVKSLLVPGGFFEQLGIKYIGPLDGHDLGELLTTFESVRKVGRPLVVHVLTEKGRGYKFAERDPEMFHAVRPFDRNTGLPAGADSSPARRYSRFFGDALCELFGQDDRIVAVTAGMCRGTGLDPIRDRFPDRFFDVGIAEEHAVVLAAGMAVEGLRPVVAIYASFMQRAMDYVFHDVCLQNLPVVFCLDRAGIVQDGPTHHGIQDLGFWRTIPGLDVLQPADGPELKEMLRMAVARGKPVMIRYPKDSAEALPVAQRDELSRGRAEILREGTDVAVWALGRKAEMALGLAEDLEQAGVSAAVVNPRFVVPFDRNLLLRQVAGGMPVVTLEDHCVQGGFADVVREALVEQEGVRLLCRGWPRQIIPWGTQEGICRKFRLDRESLVSDIREFLGRSP